MLYVIFVKCLRRKSKITVPSKLLAALGILINRNCYNQFGLSSYVPSIILYSRLRYNWIQMM